MGDPITTGRTVIPQSAKTQYKGSGAFHLPKLSTSPFEVSGVFIGDVEQGGSCNVDILHLSPHKLTHLQTETHIISEGTNISDLGLIEGFALVVDLSGWMGLEKDETLDSNGRKSTNSISVAQLQYAVDEAIGQVLSPEQRFNLLAIKTRLSLDREDTDYTGRDPLHLEPEVAQFIHDYHEIVGNPGRQIQTLILDLPSIDREDDGGLLLAHRNYFGIKDGKSQGEKRSLVEFAYLRGLETGLYYCQIHPYPIQTNAIIVNPVFYPLINEE